MEMKEIEIFVVIGADHAVFAHEGEDVILNCSVDSHVPASEIEEVTWKKKDGDESILVLLYQNSEIFPDSSHESYQGRVDFFSSEISKGNFSLQLKEVKMEDKGEFTCEVHTSDMSARTTVILHGVEHFVVKGADHAVFANEGEDVILNCSVDSHVPMSEIEEVTWKKTDGDQDILVLLYQDSEIFLDSSHESYRGRVDFFLSEITKGNFSLKLKEVKMKDRGEFTCEVHTSDLSARTTVLLHGVGFSALHVLILMFCLIALLLAVGFCGPVFNLLRKRVVTKSAMKIHISLILFPNICMIIAFCLWSKEGFLLEVITCLTVSIIRPIMLIKFSSYLNRFPKFFQKAVKVLAVPLYHLSLTMGACSPVFGLRMHLTLFLEVLIGTLLALKLTPYAALEYGYEIAAVLPALIVGILIVLSLQRHLFLGKPFGCVHITLSSLMMFAFTCYEIFFYILFTFLLKILIGLKNLFVVVLLLCAWLVVICLVRYHRGYIQRCCSHWRKIGYSFCTATAAFLFTAYGTMCIYYTYILLRSQDRGGFLALMPLLHVLAATCLFKHPKHLPDLLHIMVYMFGAVGLSTINSIVLATELILKEGKGVRNIEDLCTIVLPLETLFVSAWLILQIYDAWLRFKDGSHQFEDETTGFEVAEMEVLTNPDPNSKSE
ncbi:uncharacterized protein LOC124403113 isoform X1 [Silurus meridionalis]|nr:uncharacterized protein LOC124403113 isoform X1 [Silurus meridionalis]